MINIKINWTEDKADTWYLIHSTDSEWSEYEVSDKKQKVVLLEKKIVEILKPIDDEE